MPLESLCLGHHSPAEVAVGRGFKCNTCLRLPFSISPRLPSDLTGPSPLASEILCLISPPGLDFASRQGHSPLPLFRAAGRQGCGGKLQATPACIPRPSPGLSVSQRRNFSFRTQQQFLRAPGRSAEHSSTGGRWHESWSPGARWGRARPAEPILGGGNPGKGHYPGAEGKNGRMSVFEHLCGVLVSPSVRGSHWDASHHHRPFHCDGSGAREV